MSTRKMFKEDSDEWCEVTIELKDTDKGPELSICGSYGEIMDRDDALRSARLSWIQIFEDDDECFAAVVRDHGVSSVEAAADLVLEMDGEFHGLDVHKEDGDRVYVLHSCGQITDTLRQWFPEVTPYLRYHLNGMRAGCIHQGTGNGHKVGDVCPECGYKYGSAWMYEALPREVIDWARG